jgi:hypothetical protein
MGMKLTFKQINQSKAENKITFLSHALRRSICFGLKLVCLKVLCEHLHKSLAKLHAENTLRHPLITLNKILSFVVYFSLDI